MGGGARKKGMITDINVVRGPEKGSFRMIGPREFEYRPNADMRGHDIVVLGVGGAMVAVTHNGP